MTIIPTYSMPDTRNLQLSLTNRLQNIIGLGHLDTSKLSDDLLDIELRQFPLPTMTLGTYIGPAFYWEYIPRKQRQQDISEFTLIQCVEGQLSLDILETDQHYDLQKGDILLLHTSIAYQLESPSPVTLTTLRVQDHSLFHLFPLLFDFQPIPLIFFHHQQQAILFHKDLKEINHFLSRADAQENSLLECMESLILHRLRTLLAETYLLALDAGTIPETAQLNPLDGNTQINGRIFSETILQISQNYRNAYFSISDIARALGADLSEILSSLTLLHTNISHLLDETRLHEGLSHLIISHTNQDQNNEQNALMINRLERLSEMVGFANEARFLMLFVEKFNLHPQTFSDLFSFHTNYGKHGSDYNVSKNLY